MTYESPIDFATLSQRMLHDYDRHEPGTVFAEGLRLSLDDAWKLQSEVAALRVERGEKVVGYKVGCVCDHNQKANGLPHPVYGRLWSTEQHRDGAVLSKTDYCNVGIEGEFAVTLNRDIDPAHASPTEVAAAIDCIFPVIELHNVIMRGESPHGYELIANNAIHCGVVRGAGIAPPAAGTTDLAVKFDDEIVDSWSMLSWPEEILQSIAWMANKIADVGLKLQAGQTLLTGAFGPPIPLQDHKTVTVTSSMFGSVTATFE